MKPIILILFSVTALLTLGRADDCDPCQRRKLSCGDLNWTGEWIRRLEPCGRHFQCNKEQPPAATQPPVENGYSKDGRVYRRTASVSAVRSNDIVKAYDIGRYVDPVDCRIMHERHVVYRLENSSGWYLQPPKGQPEILLGPTVGLRRMEYQREVVAGEVGQQLNQTRKDAELAYQNAEVLKQQMTELNARVNENATRVNQNQQMIVEQLNALKGQLQQNRLPGPTPSPTPAPTNSATPGGIKVPNS